MTSSKSFDPNKEIVRLIRIKFDDKQTLGKLIYKNNVIACTLELPYNNNNKRISCIPKGIYNVVRRKSKKYGEHFHITDVPNRSLILIHHANYHYELLGCVAVGSDFKDINKDGYLDVINSKTTMRLLLKTLPLEFILEVW